MNSAVSDQPIVRFAARSTFQDKDPHASSVSSSRRVSSRDIVLATNTWMLSLVNMKAESLVHQHPPTPPDDHAHPDLHPSLHQVAQYNADRGCHYDDSPSQGAVYSPPDPAMHNDLPHGMVPSGTEYSVALQYASKTLALVTNDLTSLQDDYGHGSGYGGRGIPYNGFHVRPKRLVDT